MQTGVSVSKTRKWLSLIATVTGSVVIIATAIAFVTVDFSAFMVAPSFTADYSIDALEPLRSDSQSERNDSNDDKSGGNNNGNGDNNGDNNSLYGTGQGNGDDDDNNKNGQGGGYSDHDLPCFDPDCPYHHPETHHMPCGDPNCPICGKHKIPCDDPNCPICGRHKIPCDDPDCPICNNHKVPCDDPTCPICNPLYGFSMDNVRFKANKAEYVNEDEAIAFLSGYVDAFNRYFNRYPSGKIYLAGCIARTSNWSFTETELSQERADKVKQSLVELGIDGDKLIAVGIGINDPWRVDEWRNGYFDEELAKQNRHVWIIPDQYQEQVGLVIAIERLIDNLE